MQGDARESVLSFLVPRGRGGYRIDCILNYLFKLRLMFFIDPRNKAPHDAVFMAAAEQFASWAEVQEINDEHPIKYVTGLTERADFDELATAQQRLVLNLAFR